MRIDELKITQQSVTDFFGDNANKKTLSEVLPLQNTYDFLDTPAAIEAREEAELGQTHLIGDLADFNEWIDTIDSVSTTSIHS